MLTLVLTGNTRRMNAALYDQYFSEKTIIAKPLDSKLSNDKKRKGFNMEKYITKASQNSY